MKLSKYLAGKALRARAARLEQIRYLRMVVNLACAHGEYRAISTASEIQDYTGHRVDLSRLAKRACRELKLNAVAVSSHEPAIQLDWSPK